MPISVLIFTKNEEQDLPGCLDSVSWSDDIHVCDSMSTDATKLIAQKFGAKVTLRDYGASQLPFGGDESAHRNWALRNIKFKNEWLFYIDADERMTDDLIKAMKQKVKNPGENVAFRVLRKDYLYDTWIKHVTVSPFNIRLFRPSHMQYQRSINPIPIVNGKVGEIGEYFIHFPFSKGIAHWFSKHNSYSTFEANQIMKDGEVRKLSYIKMFLSKDINERRVHQKQFFYRLPFRPLIMFFTLYFLRRGFLDGKAGLTYAVLRAIYEYMIILKILELNKLNDSPITRKS